VSVDRVFIVEWHHIVKVKVVLDLFLDDQIPLQVIQLLVLEMLLAIHMEVEGHEVLVCIALLHLQYPTVAVMEDS
jgi:hypothetical protein